MCAIHRSACSAVGMDKANTACFDIDTACSNYEHSKGHPVVDLMVDEFVSEKDGPRRAIQRRDQLRGRLQGE